METKNIFTITKNSFNVCKSLAIGCFDGFHLGHLKLINELDESGMLLVIDKFKGKILCSNSQKAELSGKNLVLLEFEEIKNLNGAEFFQLLREKFPNLQKIIVGFDFVFGKNRAHKASDISALSGLEVKIIDEFKLDGIGVHSGVIKNFLSNGQIEKASEFLGRSYEIYGELVRGQGLGSRELFATLNIKSAYFFPKNGVYAGFCKIRQKIWPCVIFIGVRGSDGEFAIETHILDNFKEKFKEGEQIWLIFKNFLRENQKFTSLQLLKNQISKDIAEAKICLKETK